MRIALQQARRRRQFMIRRGGGIGGAAAPTPNLGAGAAAWWEVADLDTLFVERTGASASTPASVDGVVGSVLDKSGTGFHLVAPSDAARPVLRQSGASGCFIATFDIGGASI